MIELPEPDHSHLDTPEWRAYAERMQAWTMNPEKDRIRRQAKAEIERRVNAIVAPLGFIPIQKGGTGWEISKWLKVRGIYIQPSHYGNRCFFNLSKSYRLRLLDRLSMNEEHKRLGRFYDHGYDRVGEPGSLFYWDVDEFPQYVDDAMDVLAKQAIPWLLA